MVSRDTRPGFGCLCLLSCVGASRIFLALIHKGIILRKILGFCPPGILSAWILSSMGFCPCGVLSAWAFVPMGFCPHGFLSSWDFVFLGFCPLGYCPMGFCPVGFCPRTHIYIIFNISNDNFANNITMQAMATPWLHGRRLVSYLMDVQCSISTGNH